MRANLGKIWQDRHLLELCTLPVILSVVSSWYFFQLGHANGIGDTVSRLLISRSVVDGLHTGLLQLGNIWPPLPQLVAVLFIWIDPLYYSGLAGVFFPMVCFVVGAFATYKLVEELTGNRGAAIVAARVFYICPNLLYMQSIPLSDMPFVTFYVISVYYLVRWVKVASGPQITRQELLYLILCSFTTMLASMIRYEGWLLSGTIMATICLVCLKRWKVFDNFPARMWKGCVDSVGTSFYGGFFAVSWLSVWFGIAWVFFGDPFYFLRGEYSTKAINATQLELNPGVRSHAGDLLLSAEIYIRTLSDNVNVLVLVLSVIGLALFWIREKSVLNRIGFSLVLVFPVVFSIATMVEGTVTVIHHPDFMDGAYWNVRYPLQAVPAVCVFFGVLAATRRSAFQYLLTGLVLLSAIWTVHTGIINLEDGHHNLESEDTQTQLSAASWLKTHYDGGLILMQRTRNERIAYSSQFPLHDFIYEGDQKDWTDSLANPAANNVVWVVLRVRSDINTDKVAAQLWHKPPLTENYQLVYQDQNNTGITQIYRRDTLEAQCTTCTQAFPLASPNG